MQLLFATIAACATSLLVAPPRLRPRSRLAATVTFEPAPLGAGAPVREVGYEVQALVRCNKANFTWASGSGAAWRELQKFEDVATYNLCEPKADAHDVICHFAPSVDGLEPALRELADARDDAAETKGRDFVACAFVACDEADHFDDLLNPTLRKIARDRSIAVFGGEIFGLLATLADTDAKIADVKADIADLRSQLPEGVAEKAAAAAAAKKKPFWKRLRFWKKKSD